VENEHTNPDMNTILKPFLL